MELALYISEKTGGVVSIEFAHSRCMALDAIHVKGTQFLFSHSHENVTLSLDIRDIILTLQNVKCSFTLPLMDGALCGC